MAGSGNALFAFPNLSDIDYWSPTFLPGYGNWQPTAPLTNLQNRFLAYKARTVNCAPDAGHFVIDLTTLQPIQVVAIPRHNLRVSTDPYVTINLYSDAALSVLVATTTIEVYPVLYQWGSIPFEHPSYWDGKMTPEASRFYAQPILAIFPSAQLARYVEVIVSDTGNTDGYIELSRLFVCPGWQPSLNVKYGAQLGVEDATITTTSLGNADYYDLRTKRRTFVGQIDYLDQDEAFSEAFDMQMRLGLSGQFFFSYMPQDPVNLARNSFPATLTKLDPLTAAAYGLQGVSFSIKEVSA